MTGSVGVQSYRQGWREVVLVAQPNGLAAMGPFGRHSRASPEFTDGSEIGSQKASAAFVARAQIRIVLTVPGLPHQDWRGGEKCGSSVVCRQGAPATFRKGSTEPIVGSLNCIPGLDAPPELQFRHQQEVLKEGIGRDRQLNPFAAAGECSASA
jgi:hypothetical protein